MNNFDPSISGYSNQLLVNEKLLKLRMNLYLNNLF